MSNTERSLSTQLAERSITAAQWHTLSKSLFPGAKQESVLLAIDYCRARGLDPLKKPAHIVPMDVYNAQTGQYEKRDVILPGIYELRTTAQRTGEYLGHTKPEYGDVIEYKGVHAPEWCSMTAYRWNPEAQMKAEFPVTVYFSEVVATKRRNNEETPNARWSKAPRQMLTKCTEAAALREAFPDELGGELSAEEMDGQRHVMDVTPDRSRSLSDITGKGEVIEQEPEPEEAEAEEPEAATAE